MADSQSSKVAPIGCALAGLLALLIAIPLGFVVLGGGGASTVINGSQGDNASDGEGGGGGTLKPHTVPKEYEADIQKAGQRCPEMPPSLIAAQIEAESQWNPKASSGLANGIAQFTPDSWKDWGNGKSVWDPHAAIDAQSRFMCSLFTQMKKAKDSGRITRGTVEENALAGYNGGPGLPLSTGGFPTGVAETDTYVPRIQSFRKKYDGGGGGGGCLTCPPMSGSMWQKASAKLEAAIGIPYVYGGGDNNGTTMGGFDCSGLTKFVYYVATGGKVSLPHAARIQHTDSRFTTISTFSRGQPRASALAKAKPGDLLTFNVPEDPLPWGHVGIYVGNNQMIHAPNPGKNVEKINVYEGYDGEVRRLKPEYTK